MQNVRCMVRRCASTTPLRSCKTPVSSHHSPHLLALLSSRSKRGVANSEFDSSDLARKKEELERRYGDEHNIDAARTRGGILNDSAHVSSVLLSGAPRARNFAIIAHIDHGKSTLSDQLMDRAGNLSHMAAISGENAQTLDTLTVERERGITVKAQGCAMFYQRDGLGYHLTLVDTPGHVDFVSEVARSLSAVNGVLLLIDASQGIQAQTLATYEMALLNDLALIPVLTKIDLPHAKPDEVRDEILELFEDDSLQPEHVVYTSSKTGFGIDRVFDAIIDRIPAPKSIVLDTGELRPLKALLYDSFWDPHRGVICLVHIKEGVLRAGDTVGFYHAQSLSTSGVKEAVVQEIGLMLPGCLAIDRLTEGQCGYMVAGIRDAASIIIGDTIFLQKNRTRKQFTKLTRVNSAQGLALNISNHSDYVSHLNKVAINKDDSLIKQRTNEMTQLIKLYDSDMEVPKQNALKEVSPLSHSVSDVKCMVYACLYPLQSSDYGRMTQSIERLCLNDASVKAIVINSEAMGAGFRCGFLGVLHMEVFQQRLEEDSGIEIILAAPSITYKMVRKMNPNPTVPVPNDSDLSLSDQDKLREWEEKNTELLCSPDDYPENPGVYSKFLQPMVRGTIVCPSCDLNEIQRLCLEYDGVEEEIKYMGRLFDRVVLTVQFPLARIITDFYTQIKSRTRGLGSFDYEECGWQSLDLICVRILINGKSVGPLSVLCEKQRAHSVGKNLCVRLAQQIGRQLFEVNIQAVVGGKIVAKERIKQYRKNVLVKAGKVMGGGDPSRKKKLLDAQKEGKKRMKEIGKVNVPQSAFLQVLKAQ